jgi:hypothetical protein
MGEERERVYVRVEQRPPPEQVELQLSQDGWQVFGGEQFRKSLPISVAYAYEIAQRNDGRGQVVLDETRKHCGTLRLRAFSELFPGVANWHIRPLAPPEFLPGEAPTNAERDPVADAALGRRTRGRGDRRSAGSGEKLGRPIYPRSA